MISFHYVIIFLQTGTFLSDEDIKYCRIISERSVISHSLVTIINSGLQEDGILPKIKNSDSIL